MMENLENPAEILKNLLETLPLTLYQIRINPTVISEMNPYDYLFGKEELYQIRINPTGIVKMNPNYEEAWSIDYVKNILIKEKFNTWSVKRNFTRQE